MYIDRVSKRFLIDAFVWGITIWVIGYVLGIVFFFVVPVGLVGWLIMPIGILITIWILLKKIKGDSFKYYLLIGVIWTLIAIFLDYFLLVKLFKPADGYYNLDVYIYYCTTLLLPPLIGWKKSTTR